MRKVCRRDKGEVWLRGPCAWPRRSGRGLIIKNTDPYKMKKCVSCKRDIALNAKYFTYPLSLQQICIDCAEKEIPKTIELLQKDLEKIREEKARY
jgi:predicted RNA-binding Zn-ribbon protein involved in translation (DUF1610 family)